VNARHPSVVCIGGAAIDRTYRAQAPLVAGTSNPVLAASRSFGGVARNVAETLVRLGSATGLVSAVGDDAAGRALTRHAEELGIAARLRVVPGHRTAEYVAVLQPTGDLGFGLADMAAFSSLDEPPIEDVWPFLAKAQWVFADCNLAPAALRRLTDGNGERRSLRLAVDAVSTAKARRLAGTLAGVDRLFANADEARAIAGDVPASRSDLARAVLELGAGALVMTLGAEGALLAEPGRAARTLPAVRARVEDVTGAGDALIAGTVWGLLQGAGLEDALVGGLVAAALTVESPGSVRPDLSAPLLEGARARIQDATRA